MNATAILVAIIGVLGGAWGFCQFLIERRDEQKKMNLDRLEKKIDNLSKNVRELKMDQIRTNLLLLISDYSDQAEDIFILARKYFVEFNGDQYMTKIFFEWLRKRSLHTPHWFEDKLKKENIKY